MSSFLEAVRSGTVDKVKEFLDSEPGIINLADEDGRYPLHHAVSGRNINVISFLVENLSTENFLRVDEAGWLPIHIAASLGSTEALKVLLSKDQSYSHINAKTSTGTTPLHYASSKNRIESFAYLLEMGADPSIRDNLGQTPLHRAACLGYLKIVSLILLDGDSRYSHIIDYQDRQKNTCLHLAIEEGHGELAIFLMEKGANQSIENSEKKSPIELANQNVLRYIEGHFSNTNLHHQSDQVEE